jgi:hypothetical protein
MHNTVWQLISGYFQARSASVYQLFKPVDLGLQLADLALKLGYQFLSLLLGFTFFENISGRSCIMRLFH